MSLWLPYLAKDGANYICMYQGKEKYSEIFYTVHARRCFP